MCFLMTGVRRILPCFGSLRAVGCHSRGATLQRLALDDLTAKSTAIVRGKGHLVVGFVSRADHLHALPGSSQRAAGNERLFTGRGGSGRNRQQSAPDQFRRATTRFGPASLCCFCGRGLRPDPDHGLDPRAAPAFAGGLIARGGDTRGEYRTYAGGGNQQSDKG